ncbi:DUF2608 domain-containing protein [Gallaecimonas kandeliae]|uniref:DUF2608 domain-containing protein n=1 Tax=Gallaecimonas kandeliae TaxID=3029055 RepID=UPI00264A4478|nr:DUF2608 domain-containing protein [Gallaecimonas kandeliae]WKE67128.1 DUF2608 domain-containing protein [Gallaecimonas kandeliae]
MNKPLSALLCALALSPLAGQAKSEYHTVASFKEMQQWVAKAKDPAATLVVMDDDDTLTMMSCPNQDDLETCQYLGGPAWFSWQQDQLNAMAQPRVANSFNDLLTVSALLLATNDMPYTDPAIPTVLGDLSGKGVRLLVETARGDSNLSATEHQFSALPAGKSQTLLGLVSGHSLTFNGLASLAGPYQPCTSGTRPISYRQGVMYLAGQNKGTVLKCMLDSYNGQAGAAPIKQVVFIDDTNQNVKDVEAAFEDSKDYAVVALHYTRLEAHKAALTQGKMAAAYQKKATERWEALLQALKAQQQNPALP